MIKHKILFNITKNLIIFYIKYFIILNVFLFLIFLKLKDLKPNNLQYLFFYNVVVI